LGPGITQEEDMLQEVVRVRCALFQEIRRLQEQEEIFYQGYVHLEMP